MKFTDIAIKNLKPADKKYYLREANGFTIRVMPTSIKTWLFVYTFEGKRKEMNLGQYPHVSCSDARTRFNKAFELHKQGKDPAALERQEKDERRKAPTISGLVDEYLTHHAKRFKRSWEKDEAILNRDIIPLWGRRKAADIQKRDVISLLKGIIERGSPGMANNCFQIVRKMFNYAVENDILVVSPCNGVKLPAPKNSRSRVLNEQEIRTLWQNLDTCPISDETRRALKLILVTGQRPGEVAGLHTEEIDGRWWTLPVARQKVSKAKESTRSPHRIYLTDLAMELIGDTEGKDYIFPTPHSSKNKPLDSHALTVATWRNLNAPVLDETGKPVMDEDGKPSTVNRLGVDQFTPHDLRRTAATFMAQMNIMDEVIDAVLNHVKTGIIKVYNQYRYDKEKQIALEAWERKLKNIITGEKGNVIPLTKALNGD